MVSHGGQWSMMSPPAWPVDERVVWEPCVLIACLRKTGRLAVWRFCGGEDARIGGGCLMVVFRCCLALVPPFGGFSFGGGIQSRCFFM